MFAFAFPPSHQPRHLTLVEADHDVVDEQTVDDVDAFGAPFLAVEEVERPTSILALAVFGLGLMVAISLALSSPGLAGLAFVGGVVGGGILNAPAGAERLRTAAALVFPTTALAIITYAFVASL